MIGQSPGLIAFLLVKSQFISAEETQRCVPTARTYMGRHTRAILSHTTPPSHCCFMMDGAEDAWGEEGRVTIGLPMGVYTCMCWLERKRGREREAEPRSSD
ncbi:hypothetical protein AMECASPLE_012064 [Ameca splendens]|uniref:Secreted protein n=1 Tax=Ameca splendens TaxID=208324 RepID=A0ABV0YCS6_9TELE